MINIEIYKSLIEEVKEFEFLEDIKSFINYLDVIGLELSDYSRSYISET